MGGRVGGSGGRLDGGSEGGRLEGGSGGLMDGGSGGLTGGLQTAWCFSGDRGLFAATQSPENETARDVVGGMLRRGNIS